jgi:hypothetical protein
MCVALRETIAWRTHTEGAHGLRVPFNGTHGRNTGLRIAALC